MKEEEMLCIIEKAATIAAEAAAKAAVAAVQAVLGVEVQSAVEEAARIGAEIGAQASAKAVERERKKFRDARADWRLRNTKLLLRNYRLLMANCSEAIYDAATDVTGQQGIEEILDALNELLEEGIRVESIMRSAAKTQLIMDHVKRMLDIYEIYCRQSRRAEEQRHWRVIHALYLAEKPVTPLEVAARERIDKRTVYKDIDAACATLTPLIFGIDGVRKP